MNKLDYILNNSFERADIPSVAKPPKDSAEELMEVISQYKNRKNSESKQKELDEAPESLFQKTLSDKGIFEDIESMKEIYKEIEPVILLYKYIYKRKRPSEYASDLGFGWSGDDDSMSTTSTPSYPSGHAAQAYYLAHKLSDKYPKHRVELFDLAEAVATSRVDRGVHYPSDIEAGEKLAYDFYKRKG